MRKQLELMTCIQVWMPGQSEEGGQVLKAKVCVIWSTGQALSYEDITRPNSSSIWLFA